MKNLINKKSLNYKWNYSNLIKIIIILNYQLLYCQINDDFNRDILEGRHYYILDITDTTNLKLLVTTSKIIYAGIPPVLKSETDAHLINTTSLLTINENYLLAACLKDSFLTKININNGISSSLINYENINISPNLEIPKTTCSISTIYNFIFIAYSRIDETKTYKTNIVFKLQIKNKDSEDGPILDSSFQIKMFIFPNYAYIENASRQIICQPLKVSNDNSIYRLVCVYQDYNSDEGKYYEYSEVINDNFNGIENMAIKRIYRGNLSKGMSFLKLNETHGIFLMRKLLFHIYIHKFANGTLALKTSSIANTPKDISSEMDLFDYRNDFWITIEKANFNNEIYFFRIYKLFEKNQFKLYDYKENYIKRVLCHYDESTYKMNIIYQTENMIKYINLKYNQNLFTFGQISKTIELKTFQEKSYNLKDLLNYDSNLGNLNVMEIKREHLGVISTENFGFNYTDPIIDNNIFIPEESFSTWYTYTLSFFEHIKNDYTRIYYLSNVNIIVKTCYSKDCISCWKNYNQCDDCINGSYALLKEDRNKCYPNTKLLKGYVYNEEEHIFDNCYNTCDFCLQSSEDNSNHNCNYCSEGYLLSYEHPGNCYKLNSLQIDEDKMVSGETFIESSCLNNKINSTG